MAMSKEEKLALVKADAIMLFQKYHDDDTPSISLAENWELFGYTQKGHTFRAFEQCGFVEGVDYFPKLENMTNMRDGKELATKPTKDYLLTPRTLDHFGMMLRNENGRVIREAYRECRKIVEAYNEQFKQIPQMVASMVGESIKPIMSVLESLASGFNTMAARMDRIESGQLQIEGKVSPVGMSMDDLLIASKEVLDGWEEVRKEYRMAIPCVEEAEKQARRSFGKMLSTAGRNAGAIIGKQHGVSMYNERKIKEIVEKLAKPVVQFKARAKNRINPALGQGRLFNED